MPTVPIITAPISTPSGEVGVRANPNMFAGVGEAGQRLGNAISSVGQDVSQYATREKHAQIDLATKIKSATDTAYVIGASAKLEAAQQGFKTWTMENPDTSTWQDEYEARMTQVKQDVGEGAKNLGPLVRQHLNATVGAFSIRSAAEVGHLTTRQNIENGVGILNEAVNQATVANDAEGGRAAIELGVQHGLIHPKVGVAMSKRLTQSIANNQANAAIDEDPFTADAKLQEKGEDGAYANFHGLPQPQREVLQARAYKIANERRSETQRLWAQQADDARKDGTIMPDEAGVREEAARQGISPKFVDNLFKVRPDFDEAGASAISTGIIHYDADKDPNQTGYWQIMHNIADLNVPPHLKTGLEDKLKKQADPAQDHSQKTPVARAVFDRMEEDRKENGLFIPRGATPAKEGFFGFGAKDAAPYTVSGGLKNLQAMTDADAQKYFGKDATARTVIAAEQIQYAKQVAKMQAWLKANPEATEDKAEEYRQTLNAPFVMATARQSLAPRIPPQFHEGERRRQNGVVYEYDGKTWAVVK